MPPNRHLASAVVVVAAVWFLAAAGADDWPRRGPNCSGISTSRASLPATFSQPKGRRWSAKIGDGIGSPVVAAGRVFATAMTGDEAVSLFAFDAASGRETLAAQMANRAACRNSQDQQYTPAPRRPRTASTSISIPAHLG